MLRALAPRIAPGPPISGSMFGEFGRAYVPIWSGVCGLTIRLLRYACLAESLSEGDFVCFPYDAGIGWSAFESPVRDGAAPCEFVKSGSGLKYKHCDGLASRHT